MFIYLDKSDIINPHQQHIEGIYYVTDGSDHYKTKPGYYTSNFLCRTSKGNPLYLAAIVNDQRKIKQSEEEKQTIEDLDSYFINKNRVYIRDSNYSNSVMLKFLINHNDHFLMRLNGLKGKRYFYCNGNKYTVQDLIDLQSESPMERFKSIHPKKYGMATISKINGTVSNLKGIFTFIIITFDNGSEPMVLITDLDCPNLDCAIQYYDKYMDRWTIEDVFNLVKQYFALEKYNVQTFIAIQNINQLTRIAYNIVSLFSNEKHHTAQEYIVKISDGIRPNIKKLLKCIADGLEEIFTNCHPHLFEYRYG